MSLKLWLVFTPRDDSMVGLIARAESGTDAAFEAAKVADVSEKLVIELPHEGEPGLVQGIIGYKGD